jgi:light-regulated signal transduction histidine kinase (bacteriophytochrome)
MTKPRSPKIMSEKKMTKRQSFDTWLENHRGSIDWSKGDNRKNYRQTSEWQKFVDRVKKDHCEVTGLKGKLTLHHKDETHYDDLDPKKFVTILWSVHKTIHQIDRKRDKSQVPEFWLQFCPSEWARENQGG